MLGGDYKASDVFDQLSDAGACRIGGAAGEGGAPGGTSDFWNQVIYMGNKDPIEPFNTLNRSVDVCLKICAAASDCNGIEAFIEHCEFWFKHPDNASVDERFQCWAKKSNAPAVEEVLVMNFGAEVSTLDHLGKLPKGFVMPSVNELLTVTYNNYHFLACGDITSKKLKISVRVRDDKTKIKLMANFLSPPTRSDQSQPNIFEPLLKSFLCDLSGGKFGSGCVNSTDYANLTVGENPATITWENNLKRDVHLLKEVPKCEGFGNDFVTLFDTTNGDGLSKAIVLAQDDGSTEKSGGTDSTSGASMMRTLHDFVSLMMALASVMLS